VYRGNQLPLSDVYRRAAYALKLAGRLSDAVVALEQGRARELGLTLERDRADLLSLRERMPELYSCYKNAASSLSAVERKSYQRALTPDLINPMNISDHNILRRALDKCIEEIRTVGGYENFLNEPVWANIESAVADQQPLVYLLTVAWGSAALIVSRSNPGKPAGVEAVFTAFTERELETLLRGGEGQGDGGWLGAYRKRDIDEHDWHLTIERACDQLWSQIMRPLLHLLRPSGIRRAVLLPTGLLALLPLHAASEMCSGRRNYALDEVAFSYAPSARALFHARQLDNSSNADAALIVAQPVSSFFF
jgi:hypothetical protein